MAFTRIRCAEVWTAPHLNTAQPLPRRVPRHDALAEVSQPDVARHEQPTRHATQGTHDNEDGQLPYVDVVQPADDVGAAEASGGQAEE